MITFIIKNENIFLMILKKKDDELDFQNWIFNDYFNQITVNFKIRAYFNITSAHGWDFRFIYKINFSFD